MKKNFYIFGIIFFILIYSHATSENLKITIKSDPPLPFENLIKDRNPGFEQGFKFWWKQPKEIPPGDKIEISDEAFKGKHSLYIKAVKKSLGVYQILSEYLSNLLIPGENYVLSCWVKAGKKVSQVGGKWCGAGCSLSIYRAGWKKGVGALAKTGYTGNKWKKVVSEPLKCPEEGKIFVLNAVISYTKGEAWIDEISLMKAYTDLTFKVEGRNIVEVILEREDGKIIFDSGKLPENINKFSKTIKVISAWKYKVKAIDKDGNIFVKEYPEKNKH